MIQINPLKSYIDGGVRAALTTPPSASLVFDLPGKAIWVKGVKLKGTDHTYTFSHDNYITLTNTPDSNESEDIKIGVNTSALKSAIDTTYGVVSTTANGLAPKFTSGNKLAATAATTYYFLGWTGTTLKWYQTPFRNIRINSETTDCLGVNNTDPLIIGSGNGISVTWDSTNKKIIITNTKPDINHNTDTKVALSVTTLDKNYAVILKGNDSDEGSITTVNFSTYLKFNPSTKLLTINGNKVITTIDTFVGATTSADGSVGLVTKPLIANRLLFLRGDGTWATPTDTWRPVKVEGTEKLGSNALDLSAGNGISIIYNSDTKKIIITNTKPDVNHNTHYTTMLYIGENNDTKANKNVANPYLKLFDDNARRATFQIKAGSGIAVASDANGNITITNSSPDVNHNTDERVRQVPKTDNINRPLMMINGNTSTGEQINTSMFSTGIYANASTKMITANGFIKAGSSNSYVLLGGGGHKTESSLSVANADTVDLYHAMSAGSLLYKYKVTATIPSSSITEDFWYATITFSRSYVYELTRSLIDASYSNRQGLVYLNTYEHNGAWYTFTTNYNGCNIKGIALKTQNNPIYYVKLAKPVLYLNIIPDGKITVYSPYNCTITVSSTAPSGVTFTNITVPGFTNLKANSASMADLATTATYVSNVGTAGTVGTNYVTASKVIATCNWYDTMIGSDTDTVINRWSEIVAFVANFKETPDLATYLSNNYLAKSGGTMTGPLKWANDVALPELTSPKYFVCIDEFADGGTTKWTSKTNTLKALTGLTPTAIGDSNEPVYWNGTTFVKANAYPTKASWNYDDVYSKKYYYSLPPQKCVKISYNGYTPVIISACRSNGGGLFLLVGLGYGKDGWVRNQFRCLIPSSNFTWKLSANSCTVELYHNTSESRNAEIKVITTGNIVFTETDALSGNADTKRFACFDELTWANITNKPSSFTPSSHTHNYLPLSGGSLTGTLRIDYSTSLNNNYNEGIRCNLGGKNSWASVVLGGANGSTSGSGNGVYSLLVNSNLFRIRQNSTEVITINTSNNVGIGTISPSYKFHVIGDIFTTTGFKKNGSSDSYVLLGGGGHKAISDFILKTDELSNNLTTISKSLTVTQAWMDTGIKYTDLPANGTYIIQVSANNTADNIRHNYWSGIMSWYKDGTDDSDSDEIILHRAGHAYGHTIYLRTIMTTSSDGRHLRLQIAADTNLSTAVTYTFKFKRVI